MADEPKCPDMGVEYVPEQWTGLGEQVCHHQRSHFECKCPQERIVIPAHFKPVKKPGFKLTKTVEKLKVKRYKLKCNVIAEAVEEGPSGEKGQTVYRCVCEPTDKGTEEKLEITSYNEEVC